MPHVSLLERPESGVGLKRRADSESTTSESEEPPSKKLKTPVKSETKVEQAAFLRYEDISAYFSSLKLSNPKPIIPALYKVPIKFVL